MENLSIHATQQNPEPEDNGPDEPSDNVKDAHNDGEGSGNSKD